MAPPEPNRDRPPQPALDKPRPARDNRQEMSETDLPEPDRAPGAPHPRETLRLLGQARAEADFLEAWSSGRLHHGWLITGPRGIGKATLAWRIARFLLATPDPETDGGLFGDPPPLPDTLDIDPAHPVARRSRALSEPGLFLLRRGPNDKGDRISADIRVGEVRKLRNFFSMTASDGGRRVVIVDSADELNTASANAILKLLEEPPARATLLLISHQPARLLPTIRSRCRELRLAPLAASDVTAALDAAGAEPPGDAEALTALSAGSVGDALRLTALDGLKIYARIVALLGSLPRLDRGAANALADSLAARGADAEEKRALTFDLLDVALARLARTGALGAPPAPAAAPDEAAIFSRLAPDPASGRRWAALAQEVGDRHRHGRAVNVDPGALMLDALFRLAEGAH